MSNQQEPAPVQVQMDVLLVEGLGCALYEHERQGTTFADQAWRDVTAREQALYRRLAEVAIRYLLDRPYDQIRRAAGPRVRKATLREVLFTFDEF